MVSWNISQLSVMILLLHMLIFISNALVDINKRSS